MQKEKTSDHPNAKASDPQARNSPGAELSDSPDNVVLVSGQPLKEWPKDLYIPPDALEIFLETFQGPLDLLLYLIRRQNLDILDIPVAEITHQYVEYIELMRKMRLDLAAEYLVMAAMLAEIKSRMLLPRPVSDDEDHEDPRSALIRRLQEYERFRDAALHIENLPRLERDIFVVGAEFDYVDEGKPEPQVSVDDLMSAFRNVVELAALNQQFNIQGETLSVRERMSLVLGRIKEDDFVRFEDLFSAEEGRMGLVVSFVAILELVKDDLLNIVQNEPFAPIHLKSAS